MTPSSKIQALGRPADKNDGAEQRHDANPAPSGGKTGAPGHPECQYAKCGKPFTPARKGQKFCSDRHRKFACRDRKLELVRAEAKIEEAKWGRIYWHEHESINGIDAGHGGPIEGCEFCADWTARIDAYAAQAQRLERP